ncbi:prenyltransferase/squalene oxidase repeat-containing protein [Gemmata sp.]|uniref:prenyltransferase/squalene oxidase repeat-containing protein n=1 Tax=Gemmata sp. TaxID=1914242 RepID=UPI003F6F06CF
MRRALPALAAFLCLAGCSRGPAPVPDVVVTAPTDDGIPAPRPVTRRPASEALAHGVTHLLSKQSGDGAWRSDVYATFKDGTALTPFAVVALQEAHDAGARTPAVEAAITKGVAWLAKLSRKDGTIDPGPDGLDYPLYTAALAIKAYSHPTAHNFLVARDGWVKYLKERQLTEALGWKPNEKPYGGWGYCRVLPKKPEPNAIAPALIESNLSATLFALDALKTAGELDDATAKAAVLFVRRCHNYWPFVTLQIKGIDGGFHFIYDDPTRNKAGIVPFRDAPPGLKLDMKHAFRPEPAVEPEPGPSHTFNSYGSATADGVRALAICDRGAGDDPLRPLVARWWLEQHFRADTHPGTYVKAHEPNREAVYFYYAASAAKAFRDLKLALPDGRSWADELSRELVLRQKPDGSWVNAVELVRENDPLVATCSAVSALATCATPRP